MGVDSNGHSADKQGGKLWPKVHNGKIYNQTTLGLEKLLEIS